MDHRRWGPRTTGTGDLTGSDRSTMGSGHDRWGGDVRRHAWTPRCPASGGNGPRIAATAEWSRSQEHHRPGATSSRPIWEASTTRDPAPRQRPNRSRVPCPQSMPGSHGRATYLCPQSHRHALGAPHRSPVVLRATRTPRPGRPITSRFSSPWPLRPTSVPPMDPPRHSAAPIDARKSPTRWIVRPEPVQGGHRPHSSPTARFAHVRTGEYDRRAKRLDHAPKPVW